VRAKCLTGAIPSGAAKSKITIALNDQSGDQEGTLSNPLQPWSVRKRGM